MSKQVNEKQSMAYASVTPRLRSIPEILNYLTGQGFKIARRTLYLHKQQGILRAQIGGGFTVKAVDDYARRNLERPGIEVQAAAVLSDEKSRILKAQAEKIEFDNRLKQGQYVLKEEEEARDARLWFAVKADIESQGLHVVRELINKIAGLGLQENQLARVIALEAELKQTYQDSIEEIFDRYARAGGIEA